MHCISFVIESPSNDPGQLADKLLLPVEEVQWHLDHYKSIKKKPKKKTPSNNIANNGIETLSSFINLIIILIWILSMYIKISSVLLHGLGLFFNPKQWLLCLFINISTAGCAIENCKKKGTLTCIDCQDRFCLSCVGLAHPPPMEWKCPQCQGRKNCLFLRCLACLSFGPFSHNWKGFVALPRSHDRILVIKMQSLKRNRKNVESFIVCW